MAQEKEELLYRCPEGEVMEEATKNRIMEKKWKSLEKRGYIRPKDPEENKKRAAEAHGG